MRYTTELERAGLGSRLRIGISVIRWTADESAEYIATFWGDTGQARADKEVARLEKTDRARAMQRLGGTDEDREAARVAKLRRSPYGRRELELEAEAEAKLRATHTLRGHDFREVAAVSGSRGSDPTLTFKDGREPVTLFSYPGDDLYAKCLSWLRHAR